MMNTDSLQGRLRKFFRLVRAGSLKSGENWFRFVKQAISKYTSICVEVLILRAPQKSAFSPFPKVTFSCFCLKQSYTNQMVNFD